MINNNTPLAPTSCAQVLVQRCPACFSETIFSKSLTAGGDIHVSTDGNFHHQHRHSAGNCPPFYDPAYFLSKSQYNILPQNVVSHLRFATTAMHAYGHEWACQLVFNPQLTDGLELSEVGHKMRMDLGDWIIHRLCHGVRDQGKAASNDIAYSASNGLPKRKSNCLFELKQELSDDTMGAMESLEHTHEQLMSKVNMLYASLNVGDKFPELQDINLDFVQTLLLACDLKINICKRAIRSFFEWDKLDWAIGGAQKTLGMKLHQQTCKAIAKRQPALMSAICKFNTYCQQLEELYDSSWSIPLPAPLPTKLNNLRNNQSLMEDVWIALFIGHIPWWMEDKGVRVGIRVMLKHNQCLEEQHRLGTEADNLCHWFGNELVTVKLALRTSGTIKLSGGVPKITLPWVNLTTFEAPPDQEQTKDCTAKEGPVTLDPDQVIWIDYLTAEQSDLHDDNADDHEEDGANISSARITWDLPVVHNSCLMEIG
ncbi:hypothetical protein HD554DRAFT_2203599 [Boletus coccyginus]|nr:hypothetical protein HD554DRAFT_2203599 [Boletus coccyginus]